MVRGQALDGCQGPWLSPVPPETRSGELSERGTASTLCCCTGWGIHSQSLISERLGEACDGRSLTENPAWPVPVDPHYSSGMEVRRLSDQLVPRADFCPALGFGLGLWAACRGAWLCPSATPAQAGGRCWPAVVCCFGRMFWGGTSWDRNHLKSTGRYF